MSTPDQPQEPRVEPATTPSTDRSARGGSAARQAGTDPGRRDPETRTPSVDAFPVPNGPPTTGFGGHLLGILVGFALTLLAGFLVVLGQSRILAQGVGLSDVDPDALGIVLVTLGALVAGLIVILGVWTPTVPLTGGLISIAVGAAFLFAPVQAHRETVRLISTEQNRVTVLNSITVATTGGLFLTGILLLAAATALSLVRRRGLALGAFREHAREA